MRMILLTLIILHGVSCGSKTDNHHKVQYQNGQQLLTMNEVEGNGEEFRAPSIARIAKDSISVGEEFLAKIFIEDDGIDIVDAFLACEPVANPSVDTSTYKVSGCSNRLIVQNDTILIGFYPSKLGVQKFSDITILTRDKERVFRTFMYSFDYKVIRSERF